MILVWTDLCEVVRNKTWAPRLWLWSRGQEPTFAQKWLFVKKGYIWRRELVNLEVIPELCDYLGLTVLNSQLTERAPALSSPSSACPHRPPVSHAPWERWEIHFYFKMRCFSPPNFQIFRFFSTWYILCARSLSHPCFTAQTFYVKK